MYIHVHEVHMYLVSIYDIGTLYIYTHHSFYAVGVVHWSHRAVASTCLQHSASLDRSARQSGDRAWRAEPGARTPIFTDHTHDMQHY